MAKLILLSFLFDLGLLFLECHFYGVNNIFVSGYRMAPFIIYLLLFYSLKIDINLPYPLCYLSNKNKKFYYLFIYLYASLRYTCHAVDH